MRYDSLIFNIPFYKRLSPCFLYIGPQKFIYGPYLVFSTFREINIHVKVIVKDLKLSDS